MKKADMVITVYDPDDPLSGRMTAVAAVAEMLNMRAFAYDPQSIRYS